MHRIGKLLRVVCPAAHFLKYISQPSSSTKRKPLTQYMLPAVRLSRPELRSFCLFHLSYMVDFFACFCQNCGSVEKGAAGSHSLIRNSLSLFCLLFSLPVKFVALSCTRLCLAIVNFQTCRPMGLVLVVALVDIRCCCYEWRFQIESEQRFS